MNKPNLKYFFFFISGLLLFLMVLVSTDSGITCDEVLHYNHSVAVYNWFATHGEDQSALNTPVTHLKYYGQSYDNIVTILAEWFHIENIYGFRHIMSAFAGWLTIFVTALFAVWLAGFRSGILVIILFAVSPAFIGHSQNNLKDIPFALGYISGIYFTLKFVSSGKSVSALDTILLALSIAFGISIRAGGLLLICYLFSFLLLYWCIQYIKRNGPDFQEIRIKLLLLGAIIVVSWLWGILLWPYALQAPVRNVFESYRVMAHFPDTFRQIFQGKEEWSDFMPWYYLLKSMLITIPLIVTAGFCLFFIHLRKLIPTGKSVHYSFVLFTILFPIVFVLYEKSNLYSSWRQFLFLYPAIVLIAARGLDFLFDSFYKVKYSSFMITILIAILSFHPLRYMVANHRYSYVYYNQLVGGLQGANGNYETDYYYVSQTEASKWLLEYLKERKDTGRVKIKATYSVSWLFRNHPETETSYFRYEERSMSDWDYAIVVNRYIPPFRLKNKHWPPDNAIHIVYADGVPLCAVLERRSKDDFYGFKALEEGRKADAIKYFENVLKTETDDEMILYNYAKALYGKGQDQKADSVLKKCLEINQDFEPALMYSGNIARSRDNIDEAIDYYERVIRADRKYFEAYVSLAGLLKGRDLKRTRDLLRSCLEIDPGYKPAIVKLADTYRNSDPDIAKKYDELANSLKY
jgi:hypothetical protein